MKLLKKVFLLLMITCCSHNVFADDGQEEYLRKIAGIIQKTAEMCFGGDLNVGDKVKYEYRDDSQAEEFKFHSLEVVSKSSDKVTILEKFEGNNLIISYNPKNFEVLEIKGNDSHVMTVSHDVPKLLPLIPVSLNNYSMKDLLKRENCGLVENNLLKLIDFEKEE